MFKYIVMNFPYMQIIETEEAPEPVGPYSQGVIEEGQVFVSGQVGMDPQTGEAVSEDIELQTEQTMKNIEAVLEAAGTSLDNTIKSTVFLTDIDNFDTFNKVYGNYLNKPYPARSAVEVGDIISPYKIEIEMVASLK